MSVTQVQVSVFIGLSNIYNKTDFHLEGSTSVLVKGYGSNEGTG